MRHYHRAPALRLVEPFLGGFVICLELLVGLHTLSNLCGELSDEVTLLLIDVARGEGCGARVLHAVRLASLLGLKVLIHFVFIV